MPETAQLSSIFSVLASTSPTAPTADSMVRTGGGTGGGCLLRTGRMANTAVIANSRATPAKMGTVLFIGLASCTVQGVADHLDGLKSHRVGERAADAGSLLAILLDPDNPAVVHVGDLVGKLEDARVVSDDDDCAVRADGGGAEQFHDRMARAA